MPIASPRSGGRILIDQLVVQGVAQVYLRPWRILPGGARRPVRFADRGRGLPSGGRGGDRGADRGTPDRAARDLLRHARAGRHQRRAWRPYRRTRFGADDPLHRPGRARNARAGRLSGDGLSRLFRLDREMGDPDRNGEADPRSRPSRVPYRNAGTTRARGDRAARGHAHRACRGRRRAAGGARPRSGRGSRRWPSCKNSSGRPSGRSRSSEAPAGPSAPARRSPVSPSASRCR